MTHYLSRSVWCGMVAGWMTKTTSSVATTKEPNMAEDTDHVCTDECPPNAAGGTTTLVARPENSEHVAGFGAFSDWLISTLQASGNTRGVEVLFDGPDSAIVGLSWGPTDTPISMSFSITP